MTIAPTTSRLARCRDLLTEIDDLSDRLLLLRQKAGEVERAMIAKQEEMHALMRGSSPLDEPVGVALKRTDFEAQRRATLRNQAALVLREVGAPLKNTDLAERLGADDHGLPSILGGDPRLRKLHKGPPGNVRLWWRLA